jgi:beta-fructofuranosidase
MAIVEDTPEVLHCARRSSPTVETEGQLHVSLFYKPADGWAADVIPFYWRGEYHLFYLKDYRDPDGHGEGTPWFHLTTRDLLTYTDHGQALARGTLAEQDLYVFTGSVIEREGQFHIFYTGHNPHLRAQGRPEQAVMHAVSDDIYTWRKVPGDTFIAPATVYEPHDWRDPFVFWNDEAGEYWMLLAARLQTGPARRRGCTALCASADLQHWEVRAPFWAPGLYYTHECPDLFRIGEWWYLVFSEFSEATVTRYRMSRSLQGPWLAPADDTFDGRAFYAAKTATDGAERYLFGWNPTREGQRDDGRWQWGGNLVVHRLMQAADGSLVVGVPESIARAFQTEWPVAFTASVGSCTSAEQTVSVHAPGSFACAMAGPLPEECRITATVTCTHDTRACGLILRMSDDGEAGYTIRLEPRRRRLVLDCWPRAGDVPFMVELERPLDVQPGQTVDLMVLVAGSICQVYAAGTIAMSARLYGLPPGRWGVSVTEGSATFERVSLTTP